MIAEVANPWVNWKISKLKIADWFDDKNKELKTAS